MDRENKLQNCCKDVDVDGRYIDLKEILGAMKVCCVHLGLVLVVLIISVVHW